MSSATWIMAACDERYLYPNSTVMVHDGSEELHGSHTDVQVSAIESKRLQELLYEIYANNSRMPKEFWQDVCQRDLYLSAEEAVLLGLADKIIEPKKRGNLRKLRQSNMKKKPETDKMRKLMKDIYRRINKMKIPTIELNETFKEPTDPDIFVENDTLKNKEAIEESQSPLKEIVET